ncbi:MAG: AI-2E family transporter [Myxococcota bacterium]
MRERTLHNVTFFLLLALVTVGFIWVVSDFLRPLFWAAVIAVLFAPVQRRWRRAVGDRPSLAALLSVLTVVLVFILPVGFVGYSVGREAVDLYRDLSAADGQGADIVEWLRDRAPGVPAFAQELGVDLREVEQQASEAAVAATRAIASWALRAGQDVARFVALFFVMLYVLFFFFRDGRTIVDRSIQAFPLGERRQRDLLRRFVEVARGTVKGTLLIGLIQGTLGGLAFWALGLKAPVLWGAIMVVLSILPAVGAGLVWMPAAVVLLVQGRWLAGIFLVVFGVLVIGLIDNFLRPILVGRDTKMPDYLILLSTLGGLTLFGIAGFVLGPLIASLFLILWEMFEHEVAAGTDPKAVREAASEASGGAAPP